MQNEKKVAFIVIILSTSGIITKVLNSNKKISQLMLANIEALAVTEEELKEEVWDVYEREDGTGVNCMKPGTEACIK